MKNTAILFAALMLAGCASGFEAIHDYDPGNDFSGYETFAWVSEHPMKVGETAVSPSPLLEGRVMVAVESALGEKGYRLVPDLESADFALSFTVGSREKIKVDSYPSMSVGVGYGAYPSHWRWGSAYYCCATDTQVRQYTKGMLALDVFDVKHKRPVWHGVATKTITKSDRKAPQQTVIAAVAAILEGFPPR